jgi:hypothetical protein
MAWLTLGRKRLSQLLHRTCSTTDQALQYRLHKLKEKIHLYKKRMVDTRTLSKKCGRYTGIMIYGKHETQLRGSMADQKHNRSKSVHRC